MTNPPLPSTHELLSALYDADREARRVAAQLLKAPPKDLIGDLNAAFDAASQEKDASERTLRSVCIARLLTGVEGPAAIDVLIRILGSESEEARMAAGEALDDLSEVRGGEIKKAVERALASKETNSLALRELPFVILGLPDVDMIAMLHPFTRLKDADVVSSAIDAIVEFGDPDAISLLEPLASDARKVQWTDESSGEVEEVTIGDLATDAIDALEQIASLVMDDSED